MLSNPEYLWLWIESIFGFGGMIKDRFATEDVFPILGLMQSSKATNNRPSVSGEGINPQTVCQSFCVFFNNSAYLGWVIGFLWRLNPFMQAGCNMLDGTVVM
ncbi:hypothetical protein GO003_018530 [Methylicorpusculum oleiharenae]|uniref:hypothetical protein n=1 Tax=Methylicorpusculum oleiharenae TaxID=1338687 RepID=UPI00135B6DD5|nr:hypothetical protein [Methylicorpusculum oleiharenae]MCD2452388.1 hypothetical protein [Methylicorpusculum oleiharenae]